jgi:hypothetical protein
MFPPGYEIGIIYTVSLRTDVLVHPKHLCVAHAPTTSTTEGIYTYVLIDPNNGIYIYAY